MSGRTVRRPFSGNYRRILCPWQPLVPPRTASRRLDRRARSGAGAGRETERLSKRPAPYPNDRHPSLPVSILSGPFLPTVSRLEAGEEAGPTEIA